VLREWVNAAGRAVVRSAILAEVVGPRFASAVRILTYHTVPDRAAFAAQMAFLTDHYVPVGQDAVLAALGGAPLPRMAVWVTFDDGAPDVVRQGLPVLRAAGVPATMFVCPGLIESGERAWWSRVERCDPVTLRERIPAPITSTDDALVYLKSVPDGVRRELVETLDPAGDDGHQLSEEQLDQWLDAGFGIGNHTWDHPILDRCPEDEQRSQVARADAWLRARVPGWAALFAYPNGNWSPTVADELAHRRYALAVLHDHRIARSLGDRYRISRLDVRASDDVARFRGVVSGVQPTLAAAVARVRVAVGP